MKKCSKCKLLKENSEFRKKTKSKDGLKSYCKPCDDRYNRINYYNKEQYRQTQMENWREKNKDKYDEYQKQYRQNTK